MKNALDQTWKHTDTMKKKDEQLNEQIEPTQPLVRDVEYFDGTYFLQRIKKRKS
jgi:hypothetical protein